jgi:soluble lytic murein transglycosylase-like protein
MGRTPYYFSLPTVALALLIAAPVDAKKREKEKSLFDECPVAETIRVPADASIVGLESLAACEDVEVAPADPDEVPFMPPVRIGKDEGSKGWDAAFQTAALPPEAVDAEEETLPKAKKGKSSAKVKVSKGKKKEVLALGSAANGTRFVKITPAEREIEYGVAEIAAAAAPLGTAVATGSASGDAILAMRPASYTTIHDRTIADAAIRHRVDPLLVHAVIKQESAYKQRAVSHAGAQGLMQIMPGTGAMLGVPRAQLNDPVVNVDAGTRLLRKLAIKYDGNFDLVLAAYNAGEGAVAKYGNRIPPYRETQDYVRKVMGNYNQLLAENSAGGEAR